MEHGDFTEASGSTAAARALASGMPVTAIYAGNDLSALDVIDDAGLAVSGDVSLVGYDNTFVSALRHIDLTTVEQRQTELAEVAVSALLERITTGRTVAEHAVVAPQLIVRGSTAAPGS